MSKTDRDTTVQELKDLINNYVAERNWTKHHNPKNLAISIAIEAAELLEHFQWDEYREDDREKIADELADVLLYAMSFASTMDIDVATAYRRKLAKAAEKYPPEIFNHENEGRDEYFKIKKAYRKDKGETA